MHTNEELKHSLSYLQSEINRIETIAGTLSMIESDHYNTLTNFEDQKLADMAVEEQSASRQLSSIKHMCLAMAEKVDEIRNTIDHGGLEESSQRAEIH